MNKIKVGFDISPLESGHAGRGIGYYTSHLLAELKKDDTLEIVEFTNLSQLKKVDMVHYPYFDLFYRSLQWTQPFPYLITIHDLTPLLFPEHYPPGMKGKLNLQWQKLIAKKANHIITDSNTSKLDITRLFKIESQKITPVYLASTEQFQPIKNKSLLKPIQQKYHLPDKFALYVGNVNWNKNILNVCQAAIDADIDLVLVGKSFTEKENLNHPEMATFKEFLTKYHDHQKIHILGFIQEADIAPIYNLALVTLLPSLYEGFGLPILESQACGTPVITSKIASMAEVAGQSALLVDPYKVSDITKAIQLLDKDDKKYQNLIEAGFKNAQQFSWTKTAEQTVQIYQHTILK